MSATREDWPRQVACDRVGLQGRPPRHPGARCLRLLGGVRDRAILPQRPRAHHLRGHDADSQDDAGRARARMAQPERAGRRRLPWHRGLPRSWPALASSARRGARPRPPGSGQAPTGGSFTPGVTLAGVELGLTGSEVLEAWEIATASARVRGADVVLQREAVPAAGHGRGLRAGRVVHAFTVWQPAGWTTPEGLALGAPAGDIGATYGELASRLRGLPRARRQRSGRDERLLRPRGPGLGLRPAGARPPWLASRA